jgi:hypothetical protein
MAQWFDAVREQVARYSDAELVTATEMLTRWVGTEEGPPSAAMLLRAVQDEARYRAAEDAALKEPAR